jgi:hypothetical protein
MNGAGESQVGRRVVLKLHRYWIRFEIPGERPCILRLGCGVTAFDITAALAIVREKLFDNQDLPPITSVTEDVDVSTLDVGHVLPNMGSPANYGIWFPLGYQFRGQ